MSKWKVIEEVTATGTYTYEVEADCYLEARSKVAMGKVEPDEKDMEITSSEIDICEEIE